MGAKTGRSGRTGLVCAALAWIFLAAPVTAQEWVYTVVDGDTLWDLSEKYLYRTDHWKALQQINNVKNPKRMQPGTRLRVPLKWIRVNPAWAEISAISGQATLIKADGSRETELAPETRIHLGDLVETGMDSSVAIRLADGSMVTVYENSAIRFDHLSAHGDTGMVDTRLGLEKGRSDTRVRPAAGPGSRFEIRTPSAISAVRGTEYRAAVTQDQGASNIEVLDGAVVVKGTRKSRLIRAGFGTQVEADRPPIPPRKLLQPPTLDPLPDKVPTLQWPVTWQPLDGAQGYRVEVAATAAFDTLLWQRVGTLARAPFPDLPDGLYHFRVRGIDEIGLEGIDAVQQLVLDARPQPPLPLNPQQDQVVRGSSPTLAWTASSEAATYRLQVAMDEDFSDIRIDQQGLGDLSFEPSDLAEPGRYFWRLTSIAPDGEQGPPGTVRSWVVKPIPERPEPTLQTEGEHIVVSWREGAPGQTYQVQLALDTEFKQLLVDERLDQAQLALEPLKGQVRYLRVRIVEPDGYLGSWGATQKLDPAPDSSWMLTVIPALLVFLLL